MGFEDPNFIPELDPDWPLGTDQRGQGDDHLRGIKKAVQASLPNMTGPWATTDPIACGDATLESHAMTRAQANTTRQSFGTVNKQGDILGGTGDFSVLVNQTGKLTITFNDAAGASDHQVVVATIVDQVTNSSQYSMIAVWPISTTAAEIYITDATGFDTEYFSFIRIWY